MAHIARIERMNERRTEANFVQSYPIQIYADQNYHEIINSQSTASWNGRKCATHHIDTLMQLAEMTPHNTRGFRSS
jgi:hypothetical protein